MSNIFISYGRDNAEFVKSLKGLLTEQGFGVWYDESIHPGDYWWDTIQRNIDTCSIFIVVMATNARESHWVRRELLRAENLDKPIFPILLSGEVWPELADLQYIDMRNGIDRWLPPPFVKRLRELIPLPLSLTGSIEFAIQQGDIRQFQADVVVLKHARNFYGADRAVAEALEVSGVPLEKIQPDVGKYVLIETQSSIVATYALFIGVKKLTEMTYEDICQLSATALRSLAIEDATLASKVSHLAMTTHGPGFGLDVNESLLAQFRGLLDGIARRQMPPSLKQISIVEINPVNVESLRKCLSPYIQELAYATKIEGSDWRYELAIPNKILSN